MLSRHISLCIVTLSLLLPTFSYAATPTLIIHPGITPDISQPSGLVSCSNAYMFGSVVASLSPTLTNVAQGVQENFSGTLTNRNPYPAVNVAVYAKVFQLRTSTSTDPANGPDVVGWYPVIQGVTLQANQSIPLSFVWNVPNDEEPGQYQIATYVVSDSRFNLSGLSFTDDVTGDVTPFNIVGQSLGAVRFDKDSVTVNGGPFYFSAYPPVVTTPKTNIQASVVNSSYYPYIGSVTWNLYWWDGLQQAHFLGSQTDPVNLFPNASTTVSYTVTDTAHSVYYLVGTLTTKNGDQSIIDVRYDRGDVNEPRLNFVGVTGYPATSTTDAVACFHSSGTAPASTTTVTLTATNTAWYAPILSFFGLATLAHATYTGAVPGNIYALETPFTHSSASFNVTATIAQNGKQIDSVTMPYSCTTLGALCDHSYEIYIPLIVILLIILIATISYIRMRKRSSKPQPTV